MLAKFLSFAMLVVSVAFSPAALRFVGLPLLMRSGSLRLLSAMLWFAIGSPPICK
jgi:hypothetical protein